MPAMFTHVWAYQLPTWAVLALLAFGAFNTVALTLFILYMIRRKKT